MEARAQRTRWLEQVDSEEERVWERAQDAVPQNPGEETLTYHLSSTILLNRSMLNRKKCRLREIM